VEYRYTSTEERVYADRALVVSPGDVVDWDTPPADGHWIPATDEAAPPTADELADTDPWTPAPAPASPPVPPVSAPSPAPAAANTAKE
jgi:hypothetical protein